MESYCVKQKKFTECIEPKGYKKSKNGKLMFYCKCKECGIMKYKFVKKIPLVEVQPNLAPRVPNRGPSGKGR